MTIHPAEPVPMSPRTPRWRRPASAALLGGLALILAGDRSGLTSPLPIDPLDVLDLAVKNNVLFIIDTSSSMSSVIEGSPDVGGDDPASRFYQTKIAVRRVLELNRGTANFGLATFHPDLEEHKMTAQSGGEGPLIYVSQDASAADWLAFFKSPSGTFSAYDGPTSGEVFQSFDSQSNRYNKKYPDTCTPALAGATAHVLGTDCRYYLRSLLLRDNVQYTWNRSSGMNGLTATTPITCPKPPARLLGDDTQPSNDGTKRSPCVQFKDAATGKVSTYFFSSSNFNFVNVSGPSGNCSQTGINVPVSACTGDTSQQILDLMRLELQRDASGSPIDVPGNTNLDQRRPHNPPFTTRFDMTGIRQGNGTPLGASLNWARTYFQSTLFPTRPAAVVGKQKNFVILLTDGAESCSGNPEQAAKDLYNLTPSPDNRVETFVIVFADTGSVGSANKIARGGSGGVRDAYSATNVDVLVQALNEAIVLSATSGTFANARSIVEQVYELGGLLSPPVSALDPQHRYDAFVPTQFRSTFDMPGFKGRFKAFRNAGGASTEVWDAGSKLLSRVQTGLGTCLLRTVAGVSRQACTFAELHGGATDANVGTVAKLPRRIYTTYSNYLDPVDPLRLIQRSANNSYRIPLWPPTTSVGGVAPADTANSSGVMDAAMGLSGLTEGDLKLQFAACRGANLPADCTTTAGADGGYAKRLQQHRREAREMILAFTAGAQSIKDSVKDPVRDATSKQVLYEARPWILAESTLSAPAVVPPPLEAEPTIHLDEYKLFRDGPRAGSNAVNGISGGFGLRNPDKDGTSPSAGNADLKPSMTVVYYGGNHMLHAFRAGPCPSTSLPCAGETGGEELWSFVPYDQLGKLPASTQIQTRASHVYMIATPIRFSDVFVPGSFSTNVGGLNVTGSGVWRTFLYFGRGIAGKYLTALDVTVPGPLTRHSLLSTDAYAPLPVWSRGNPDTNDGKPKSALNSYNNNGPGYGFDYISYLKMGETWSVPAIATVPPADNWTMRKPNGVEFAAFVGSGYGATGEGTTFYALDALTGDVIGASDVDLAYAAQFPPVTPIFRPNAIVANPAVFNPKQISSGLVGHPASGVATRVYVGDLYGRLWKFTTNSGSRGFPAAMMYDFGVAQPIGAPVALLKLNTDSTKDKPHIYVVTGRDNRVAAPPSATPPFKFYALRDETLDDNMTATPPPTLLFKQDFPERFRGISQPATGFNAEQKGRVLFTGVQFNPIGADCISSFDSILFGLTAGTGVAAYDLGPEPKYTIFKGEKITDVSMAQGAVVLDKGIAAGNPPPPPAAPILLPGAGGGSSTDVYLGPSTNSSLAGLVPLRFGTAVCP